MSAVTERWELVEALLFSHVLRDPGAFLRGATTHVGAEALAAIKREHRFEEPALARALQSVGQAAARSDSMGAQDIHSHLIDVASRWLVLDGGHWSLRMDAEFPGRETVRWRGVTMLLPPSIVVAGALARTERVNPCRVQLLSPSVAPDVPVAHLHVHLGPLLSFESLWTALWNAFLQRGSLDAPQGGGIASVKPDDLPEIGRWASKRTPGLQWQFLLELAFAARVTLLRDGFHGGGPGCVPPVLETFGLGRVDVRRRGSELLALHRHLEWRTAARRAARSLAEATFRQDRAWEASDRATARLRARDYNEARGHPRVTQDATLPHDADDEIIFMARALGHCAADAQYARLLYQYLRVKVGLYRQLVVDPWTTGLRHFLDVVKRDGPYLDVVGDAHHLDRLRLDAALAEAPLQVGALEVHTAPSRWLKGRRRAPSPHTWILSFARVRAPETKREKKDPTGPWTASTWNRVRAEASATCRHLARSIARNPRALRELRGIGLMDWERNGPVHLFEAAFRQLLDASAHTAAAHPSLGLSRLRTAFHLGEDFDHLLTGLRQIFEPFEWGLIQRGDRIGHALALGLAPEAWCNGSPWVQMRPWDRLLDVGFVYWAFDVLGLSMPAEGFARLGASADEALLLIFERREAAALQLARDLWATLPSCPVRSAQGPGRIGSQLAEARRRHALLRSDRRVGERALTASLTVETAHDLPVLSAIHQVVRDRVARSHVAVEVNPSSNLLIGGFRSIFEQPAFHEDDIPITINADDPLTFGTTLADEYAYAWAGMVVGAGEQPHKATRRLKAAARYSMRYAFSDRSALAAPGAPRRAT